MAAPVHTTKKVLIVRDGRLKRLSVSCVQVYYITIQMPQDEINLIPIDIPKSDFDYFLSIDSNKRIFFSGKYGIGKSFFLQKFFEEHVDKYDTFHLFPVRYQITTNENIIELLKYDILVELLKKYPNAFQNSEVKGVSGWVALLSAFYKEKASVNGFLQSVITTGEEVSSISPDPFFQVLGKLGRPLKELLKIDKEFQEFKKEYVEGDKQEVEKFLKEIRKSTDIVATDYLSHLLRTKIIELKGERKSVLVLDDFDRIDPDHIFRILNILSAHMEGDEDNKFGFDHIVIVGDIKNLKSIFHHKYGTNTEFLGYFDKFFTVRPYIFNNEKAVAERIPQLLQNIKYEDPNLKNAITKDGIVKNLLEEVLIRALKTGVMNLRQLYKPINHSFPEVKKGVFYTDHFSDQRNQCIDIGIKLLISLYGDKEYFIEILKKIRDASSDMETKKGWFYATYSDSMLRRMLVMEPGETRQWHKHSLIATDKDQTGKVAIQLNGGVNAHPKFFFDTLLEYVIESKYEKENFYDYEGR